MTQSHNQSSIILQQFSMITEELKNFTNKVSSDITKITQVYNTAQEITSKLIENTISQVLTKAQNTTTPSTSVDPRNLGVNYANASCETNWTSVWPTFNLAMSQQPEIDTHQTHRPYKVHTPPQTCTNQQYSNQTPFDFNQSVVELFRHQTELTYSTQCLHQLTTDALNNITKSSSLQENVHFINDIPIFKSKDPKSFDGWLEQIDKVTSLMNKDPYKLTLVKSHSSFSRTINSYPLTLGWNKIKEQLCYNFGSVTTKQHTTSILIEQQQKPSETLQEYILRFSDLALKLSRLLPHQAKYLAHITHFI